MKIIGLTGGIASGKSTVSKWLVKRGVPVLDADVAAREVVRNGSATLALLADEFGAGILMEDGELDRPGIAKIVFSSAKARKRMNRIMHPAIYNWLINKTKEKSQKGYQVVVWDAPLLVDLGWEKYVDEVWVVKAKESQQLQRIMARDGATEEMAKNRLAAQISRAEREAAADIIIDNSGSIEETYEQLEKIWEQSLRSE